MTEQQKRVLDFVRGYYAEHGRSPTQRVIMDALDLASPSGVHRKLQWLAEHGFLRREGNYSGNYVPDGSAGPDLSRVSTPALRDELDRRRGSAAR